jgi:hypothetical protein
LKYWLDELSQHLVILMSRVRRIGFAAEADLSSVILVCWFPFLTLPAIIESLHTSFVNFMNQSSLSAKIWAIHIYWVSKREGLQKTFESYTWLSWPWTVCKLQRKYEVYIVQRSGSASIENRFPDSKQHRSSFVGKNEISVGMLRIN